MRPYVIKQGDYLAKLAYKFRFDAKTVWMDDKNSALRALRSNPNILFPSDILYIPDASPPPVRMDLVIGQTNVFISNPPTIQVVLRFKGEDTSTFARQLFAVEELPHLTGLQTNADGLATIDVPVTLSTITLTFAVSGVSQAILIADMDPINTLPGIFKRLQNLACIGRDAMFDVTDLDTLRSGLRMLKANVDAAATPACLALTSSQAISPSGSATASGLAAGSALGVEPQHDPAPNPSSQASSNGFPPPSSLSPGPSSAERRGREGAQHIDNGGLDDAGTLDEATTVLLLEHHGS